MSNEFTCEACGGTFQKAWSDEEAQAESDVLNAGYSGEMSVVCDECFQGYEAWLLEHAE